MAIFLLLLLLCDRCKSINKNVRKYMKMWWLISFFFSQCSRIQVHALFLAKSKFYSNIFSKCINYNATSMNSFTRLSAQCTLTLLTDVCFKQQRINCVCLNIICNWLLHVNNMLCMFHRLRSFVLYYWIKRVFLKMLF